MNRSSLFSAASAADRSFVASARVPVSEVNEDAFVIDRLQPYNILIDSANRDTVLHPNPHEYMIRLPKTLYNVKDVTLMSYQFPIPRFETGLNVQQRSIPLLAAPPFFTTETTFVRTPAMAILPDITYSLETLYDETQGLLDGFFTILFVTVSEGETPAFEVGFEGMQSIVVILNDQGTPLNPRRLAENNIYFHFSSRISNDLIAVVLSPQVRVSGTPQLVCETEGVATRSIGFQVEGVPGDRNRLRITATWTPGPRTEDFGADFIMAFASESSTRNRTDSLAAGLLGFIDENQIFRLGAQSSFPPFEAEVPQQLQSYVVDGVFQGTVSHFRLNRVTIQQDSSEFQDRAEIIANESTNPSSRVLAKQTILEALTDVAVPDVVFPNRRVNNPMLETSDFVATVREGPGAWTRDGEVVSLDLPNPVPAVDAIGSLIRPPLGGVVASLPMDMSVFVASDPIMTAQQPQAAFVLLYATSSAGTILQSPDDPEVAYKLFIAITASNDLQESQGRLVAQRMRPEELVHARDVTRTVGAITREITAPTADSFQARLQRSILNNNANIGFINASTNDNFQSLHLIPSPSMADGTIEATHEGVTQTIAFGSIDFFGVVPVFVEEDAVNGRYARVSPGVHVVKDYGPMVQGNVRDYVGVSGSEEHSYGMEWWDSASAIASLSTDFVSKVNTAFSTLEEVLNQRETLLRVPSTGFLPHSLRFASMQELTEVANKTRQWLQASEATDELNPVVLAQEGTISNAILPFVTFVRNTNLVEQLELPLVEFLASNYAGLLQALQETGERPLLTDTTNGSRQAFRTGIDVPYFLMRISGMDNIEIARPPTRESVFNDQLYMDDVFAQIRIDDTNADLVVNNDGYAPVQLNFKPAIAKLDKLKISIVRPNGAPMDFNLRNHNFVLQFHALKR